MKVFVAGATGAVGRPLVRDLVEAGHEVVGTTRSPEKFGLISEWGATPVAMDALDAGQVGAAVRNAAPEVVVHELTALAGMRLSRRFDQQFAATNRLRTHGLDLLLDAARASGARRFIAQSYAGWPAGGRRGAVVDESVPFDPDPAPEARESLAAIEHLERVTTGAEGIDGVVLRYGPLYGPGTNMTPGEDMWEAVAARKIPLIGDGAGQFSFLHTDDAAAAAVLALDHGEPGVYNVVDDDPAPVASWLPYLADLIRAKAPRHLPAWLARPLAGRLMVTMMTAQPGVSNAKARRELGFQPLHPSWREAFATLAGNITDARTAR